jgi:hypothetical protein
MIGWGKSYAKLIDNASLAVSAASNGTTVPFTSLYQLLNTTDATLSYTGGANITTASSSGAPTYSEFSTAIGLVESGDYFDPGSMYAIAHPAFRKSLRGVLDSQNRPIFVEGLSGTPDTVFGVPIRWSLGAKLAATATPTPTGRSLMASSTRSSCSSASAPAPSPSSSTDATASARSPTSPSSRCAPAAAGPTATRTAPASSSADPP